MKTRSMRALLCGALLLATACTTVSAEDRRLARVHYDLGVSYLREGQGPRALRELLTAENRDPTDPEIQNALGLSYHSIGKREDAIRCYRRAIELKEDYSEAKNNLGAVLMDEGRYEEAATLFRQVLDDIFYRSPTHAEANLGWALFKLGKVEEGIQRTKNALYRRNDFCLGHRNLGIMYQESGQTERAEEAYERFVTTCLDDPKVAQFVRSTQAAEVLYRLGATYVKLGQRLQARQVLHRCEEVDPMGPFATDCRATREELGR